MKPQIKTPLTPISWGELLDKITILEIKQIKITAPQALGNVRQELHYLNAIIEDTPELTPTIFQLKADLLAVNQKLWKVEDDIRDKEAQQAFDSEFIHLARQVYRMNDDRAKIKKAINLEVGSELMEEKSYKDFAASLPSSAPTQAPSADPAPDGKA
jgi:Family of unknown function (DUF6165)